MFKADIESAFRRVPLKPEHRNFATIAFKVKEMIMILQHMAAPFGAVSSVHNWERVGETRTAFRSCEYIHAIYEQGQ